MRGFQKALVSGLVAVSSFLYPVQAFAGDAYKIDPASSIESARGPRGRSLGSWSSLDLKSPIAVSVADYGTGYRGRPASSDPRVMLEEERRMRKSIAGIVLDSYHERFIRGLPGGNDRVLIASYVDPETNKLRFGGQRSRYGSLTEAMKAGAVDSGPYSISVPDMSSPTGFRVVGTGSLLQLAQGQSRKSPIVPDGAPVFRARPLRLPVYYEAPAIPPGPIGGVRLTAAQIEAMGDPFRSTRTYSIPSGKSLTSASVRLAQSPVQVAAGKSSPEVESSSMPHPAGVGLRSQRRSVLLTSASQAAALARQTTRKSASYSIPGTSAARVLPSSEPLDFEDILSKLEPAKAVFPVQNPFEGLSSSVVRAGLTAASRQDSVLTTEPRVSHPGATSSKGGGGVVSIPGSGITTIKVYHIGVGPSRRIKAASSMPAQPASTVPIDWRGLDRILREPSMKGSVQDLFKCGFHLGRRERFAAVRSLVSPGYHGSAAQNQTLYADLAEAIGGRDDAIVRPFLERGAAILHARPSAGDGLRRISGTAPSREKTVLAGRSGRSPGRHHAPFSRAYSQGPREIQGPDGSSDGDRQAADDESEPQVSTDTSAVAVRGVLDIMRGRHASGSSSTGVYERIHGIRSSLEGGVLREGPRRGVDGGSGFFDRDALHSAASGLIAVRSRPVLARGSVFDDAALRRAASGSYLRGAGAHPGLDDSVKAEHARRESSKAREVVPASRPVFDQGALRAASSAGKEYSDADSDDGPSSESAPSARRSPGGSSSLLSPVFDRDALARKADAGVVSGRGVPIAKDSRADSARGSSSIDDKVSSGPVISASGIHHKESASPDDAVDQMSPGQFEVGLKAIERTFTRVYTHNVQGLSRDIVDPFAVALIQYDPFKIVEKNEGGRVRRAPDYTHSQFAESVKDMVYKHIRFGAGRFSDRDHLTYDAVTDVLNDTFANAPRLARGYQERFGRPWSPIHSAPSNRTIKQIMDACYAFQQESHSDWTSNRNRARVKGVAWGLLGFFW